MEFHSRRNVHELFQKGRGFRKINIEGFKDENDPFASLNVEDEVMESLKDDLDMMKDKSHENYGIKAEELADLDLCF